MATYTVLFPEEIYPADYPGTTGLEDMVDFNPMFGELFGELAPTLGETSSTEVFFDLGNGIMLKLTGTGFEFDEEDAASDGKISKLELFYTDEMEQPQRISSLTLSKVSLVDFMESWEIYGPWGLQSWLMNRADVVNGSNGHDDLSGFGGNDVLNGRAGDDFMVGGEGKDRYDGGADWDTISFADSKDNPDAIGGISIDFAKQKVTDQFGNLETFKNVEGVRGTHWRDTMTGSSRDEDFMGLGGRDIIDGKGGIDSVRYHRDERNGGDEVGVTVDLGAGTARDGFGKIDKLSNIENVRGTRFDDTLVGSDADNNLRGDDGADTISGGLGDDYIQGGAGNDELEGGDGSDIFRFDTNLDDSENVDVISDFNAAEDQFHLMLSIFDALAGEGTLGAAEFAANADGDATTADQRILYSTDTGELFYDADGSGTGDKIAFAVIETGLTITADNFFVF